MCTNRPDSIDPAVSRRAAHIFVFERPDDEQRRSVLTAAFVDAGIDSIRSTNSLGSWAPPVTGRSASPTQTFGSVSFPTPCLTPSEPADP